MARVEDIGWGAYRNYEGPFYRGKHRYELPAEPTETDKVLAVVTATEGGRYDAINMYDGRPVISSGLIQFIEGGQGSVSQMIGSLTDGGEQESDKVFSDFVEFVHYLDYDFSHDGKWYFSYDTYDGCESRVDTQDERNELFRKGSNGEKGTWGQLEELRAKEMAAAVATIWEHPVAQKAQREFTLPQLEMFAFGDSRKMIKYAVEKDTNISHAFIAAYLSFAVNNPTRANRHLHIGLERALKTSKESSVMWSVEWLIEVLKELTFGPQIAIYPHRYNAIRGPLEKLYGIDLPDMAEELRNWQRELNITALSTKEVQKALLALGEDLGPHGADGQYGRKTRSAMLNVELRSGIPKKYCDGMLDVHSYGILEDALAKHGASLLRESS